MFSLRYCKDITNLLFWVLWTCLTTHTKSDTINMQKSFMFICRQKSSLAPTFFWRCGKDMQIRYFGYFGHAWLLTPKVIISTCGKLSCLSEGKKSTLYPTFFWRCCKDMQTSYFGTLGMPHYAHPKR